MARAIRAGRVHVGMFNGPVQMNPDLTCSPAPCVLPNVNASGSTNVADETPVVVNQKNSKQILTGANDYNCSNIQGFYASTDGGTTWNRTCLNALSGDSGDGDPVVGYDLKGNAFIGGIDAGSTNTIGLEKSTDGGKTWGSPFASVTYLLSGSLVDKPWLQIDVNPKSKYVNSLYISTTQFDGSSDSEITVASSHDGGSTWKTVLVDSLQTYPTSVDQFSDVGIAADGTVYATWMRCPASSGDCAGQTATFYMTKSKDGGSTWSKPSAMFTATLAGGTCGFYGCLPNTSERVSDIPVIGIDNSKGPHKGNLYAVYYNWTGTYMQVFVATSKNGGKTWKSKAVAPSSDTHDQFFPWLSVNGKGTVGVSWLDRRNDPNNVNYESFGAFSTNGGASFGTNEDLSAKLSDPFNDGFDGGFMGDYTGDYWAGNKTFYVSFTDTTTGIAQDFIGGYLR
jgi:Neuraminidase (sialidase)